MKQEVKIGQQDYTVLILVRDTDGAPKTGLTFESAGIDVCYVRVETDNDVVLTDGAPVTTTLTGSHTDWGFVLVDDTKCPGLYKLDIADGVFAAGAWSAVVSFTCTGCDPVHIEFVLVPEAPGDGVKVNSLAADVITAAGIADNAFANEHFANGALTSTEITSAAGCVVASIANDAITAAAIQNGAIDAATFAANAITSTVIADDAITAAKLNTGAITADAFAADAIVAATLATGAITADAFAADAIVAATLATGALTADAFAANAITNAAVADDVDVNVKTMTAGVITAAVIADGAIDAATFAAGAIDAAAIAANAIDAATFAADVDAEVATWIWNAAVASYGGAGTYGQAVEDVLADTNELQTDLANGGRLDLLIDGVKAKTDSLTFTVGNQVDANIQYINDTAVTGDGGATPWGPA